MDSAPSSSSSPDGDIGVHYLDAEDSNRCAGRAPFPVHFGPPGLIGRGRFTFKRRQRSGSSRYLPFPPTESHEELPTEEEQDDEEEEEWVAEGPGRRIYEDLTAIDWIFEYTRERLRQRKLEQRTGLLAHAYKWADQSQIWVVLVGTGVLAGCVAAVIDIVAAWLGDLKEGYCSTSFYLSRNFCCWGVDGECGVRGDGERGADEGIAKEPCRDWVEWSQALGTSRAGSYVVGYILYILFSVSFFSPATRLAADRKRSCLQ
jgi:chloride channel 3/4/5